jgi:hypothetical protein
MPVPEYYAPMMPAPEKEPAKTPPDTTPPTTPPVPPSAFGEAPAAGTEAGGSVGGTAATMFGAPFGGGGAISTIGPKVIPGKLNGPATITFSNVNPAVPIQNSTFSLMPLTLQVNGQSATISSVSQLPPMSNPSAASAYFLAAYGIPVTKSQTSLFLNYVSGPLLVPPFPAKSNQASGPLNGQPSPVFAAAQAVEQGLQPHAVLRSLQITATDVAKLIIGTTRSVEFDVNVTSQIAAPFNNVPPVVKCPDPAAGGTVGRQRPSEDTTPLPSDRFILNYDYFSNVQLGVGSDVNRCLIGFEKTFFGGLASVEFRLPFAATVASDLDLNNQATRTEVGDLRITPRFLLWDDGTFHVGAGMSIYLPTADKVTLNLADGTPLVQIPNRAVVLSPYIGILYTPDDRLFAQAAMNIDFDTNGDPVSVNADGAGLRFAGRLQDPANLGLDFQLGYWIYKGNRGDFLSGLAPFVELHYTGNLQPRGVVSDAGFVIPSGTVNEVNMTTGLYAFLSNRSTMQFGVVIPLRQDDKQFSVQFGVHCNFFFGPRITPVYSSF